ncbi:MAG: AIR synthase-related protein [Planctomycetota bacterium]
MSQAPASPTDPAAEAAPRTIDRVEVWPATPPADPPADWAAALPGLVGAIRVRVFLIERPEGEPAYDDLADALLVDPVAERLHIGIGPAADRVRTVEVHHQPGVMDPVAMTVRDGLFDLRPGLPADLEVRTADRIDLAFAPDVDLPGDDLLADFARTRLANTVIHDVHLAPHHPDAFAHPGPYEFRVAQVPLTTLDDDALQRLSREAHLFLSLDEMRTIRDHFVLLQREPTDIELETLAQTWSEHCVHKTLKATVRYTPRPASDDRPDPLAIFRGKPGHETHPDGTVTIHNLLKSTVAAATFTLRDNHPAIANWLVSVFDDNAGIVRLDDTDGVAIKVETHNHPSAIEPYGGAATGIGGCIRDVMGTGLFARPIANTSAFFTAPPDTPDAELPDGVIRPRRLLEQVVAGVRDYGNRMGIPTVNGCTHFDPGYVGNPLVFAGCVGLIPLDKCFGDARPGDLIVALGGLTGRDGIHGATFSSAELTDAHADEFGHAVQIGNAITQKRTLDAILAARDHPTGPLFSAITDCGAGGFSSAIGEMAEQVGAEVDLDKAPLKYAGLSYTEVWISEAQERMVLSVPPDRLDVLQAICDDEGVPLAVLGRFGVTNYAVTPQDGTRPTACAHLVLRYEGHEVGRLSMPFLHDGLPNTTRLAADPTPIAASPPMSTRAASATFADSLHALLAHPNLASKHWVVRQYDHEVQGGTVIKPLVGPDHRGPSDAAVIRPKPNGYRAIALGNGVCPWMADPANGRGFATDADVYQATLHAIDEAVRNVVCVGATPFDPAATRDIAAPLPGIAILDNFCWPSCDDPESMGSLVRAAEACYDGALAYHTPFVSGKDSLHNQFTTADGRVIAIPPTLLVTALAVLPDASRCVTMDLKRPGNRLIHVGPIDDLRLGGSHLGRIGHAPADADLRIPTVDLAMGPRIARAVAALIAAGHVASAHDCSEGGLLPAAAEMCIASGLGLNLGSQAATPARLFGEAASRYLLEVRSDRLDAVVAALRAAGVPHGPLGVVTETPRLMIEGQGGPSMDEPIDDLRRSWLTPLDW